MSDRPLTTEKEVLLLIKRIGLDKTWQVAPYKIASLAAAEKLVKWLELSLPAFEYKVIL